MELTGGSFQLEIHDILADGKATEFRAFAEDQAELDTFFG
jgi:hypothetical protein